MKKTAHLIACLIMGVAFVSCEMLPLYTDPVYNGKPLDMNQHMTCWEFIKSRPDLLSNMKAAIDSCGMSDYYSQTQVIYTYLLLSNAALTQAEVQDATTTPEKRQALKNILLYHIIQGNYGYGTLGYNVVFVITLWQDPNAIMSLRLGTSSTDYNIQDGLYAMELCGNSTVRRARTSNLMMTNGPAHVFDSKLVYVK